MTNKDQVAEALTLEPHGDGYAVYSGRVQGDYDPGDGSFFSGSHGNRLFNVTDATEAGLNVLRRLLTAPVPEAPGAEEVDYDAGLLNDWGGGNVEWWQDYLRAEIDRANEHWRSILDAQRTALSTAQATIGEQAATMVGLRAIAEMAEAKLEDGWQRGMCNALETIRSIETNDPKFDRYTQDVIADILDGCLTDALSAALKESGHE